MDQGEVGGLAVHPVEVHRRPGQPRAVEFLDAPLADAFDVEADEVKRGRERICAGGEAHTKSGNVATPEAGLVE